MSKDEREGRLVVSKDEREGRVVVTKDGYPILSSRTNLYRLNYYLTDPAVILYADKIKSEYQTMRHNLV